MPNRLIHETSPYLRQHGNNPVDWYPWGDEALEKSKKEKKPILLSIGYSACHWCHVMEHESFENPEIAKIMNENFVNIKVDREERPDLDQIYQNVAQLMTRSGGWPLTVFLTPDLKPFYGGTYFPPENRYGRPGFGHVLQTLSKAFREDPDGIAEQSRRFVEAIEKLESVSVEEHKRPSFEDLQTIADQILEGMDLNLGGLKGAPKFPNTMLLSFLWRQGTLSKNESLQNAVLLTLRKMAQGGIYDHLGGGFHRYSVDERWLVPHFEKMLYDNALLLKLYSEVLVTPLENMLKKEDQKLFLSVIEQTTNYVLREMQDNLGGFYSTQDADSLESSSSDSKSVEGAHFIWSYREVADALTAEETEVFARRFGVTHQGNFEHTQKSVLQIVSSVADIARSLNTDEVRVEELLRSGKEKLFKVRLSRPKPATDEKILTSWNGLMISGLCWAARALYHFKNKELSTKAFEAAQKAMEFIHWNLSVPTSENIHDRDKLFSVYKDGKAKIEGFLDDYAFLTVASLDLARFSSDTIRMEAYLHQAKHWLGYVWEHFADKDEGGFFFTSDEHEKLIVRPKTLFDQAIPSGVAMIAQALLALSEITSEATYGQRADEILHRYFPVVEKSPFGMGELCCASLMFVYGPIVISGKNSDELTDHPHVFHKPPNIDESEDDSDIDLGKAEEKILVCWQKTCETAADLAQARRLVTKKLQSTL